MQSPSVPPPWTLPLQDTVVIRVPRKQSRDVLEEEQYMTTYRPHETGRPEGVVGAALVVHFAYTPQRTGTTRAERAPLLREYEALADRYCAQPLRSELPVAVGEMNGATAAEGS